MSFHANNHTNRLTVAALLVTVGDGTPATRYLPPTYSEFARRTVPLNLAPKEDRDFACEFPITVHPFPNVAQVEIAPFAIPNP